MQLNSSNLNPASLNHSNLNRSNLDLSKLEHLIHVEPQLPSGFRIVVLARPVTQNGVEEFYDILKHAALFESRSEATALSNRIKDAGRLNLEHWVWPLEPESKVLPKWRPSARLETLPRIAKEAAGTKKARAPIKTHVEHKLVPNADEDQQPWGEYWGYDPQDNSQPAGEPAPLPEVNKDYRRAA